MSEASAGSTARLVIVGPPGPWRDAAVEVLTQAWYLVTTIDDGIDIVHGAVTPRADLAIVDLGLSAPSGVEICAALRSRSAVVLLAVGPTAREDEIVAACEAGADGCLGAPASPRILLARVAGLLRRIPAPARQWMSAPLSCGELVLDPETGATTARGERVLFRGAERELLEVLITNHHRVVRRSELVASLSSAGVSDNDLDGHIRRLREHIDELGVGCTVRTIRKVGVRLVQDDVVFEDPADLLELRPSALA